MLASVLCGQDAGLISFVASGYGMNKSELFSVIQLLNILLAPRLSGASTLLIAKEGCVCDEEYQIFTYRDKSVLFSRFGFWAMCHGAGLYRTRIY